MSIRSFYFVLVAAVDSYGIPYEVVMDGCDLIHVTRYPDGRLDRKNAAAYLGYAPKTLAEWRCKGIGPKAVRVGGRVFYFQSDLDAWVAAQSDRSNIAA